MKKGEAMARFQAHFCLSTACAAFFLGAMPVAAQPAATTGGVEEVVVTARKMQESILKVPIIETVVSGPKIEHFQITSVADLQKFVPGLDLGQNVLAIGTQVAIRGVGTTAYDQGVDQSVSLNIDGVTMGNGLAFQSGLFDLANIQVLKGPQSLFYGKSTTAGVIAITTADPTDEVEVIGQGAYETEANTWQGEAIASGAVTDTLKVRLSGQYTTSDGYFRAGGIPLPGTGAIFPKFSHGPNSEDYKVRLTMLWDPTERLSFRFKANYDFNFSTDASPEQLSSCQSRNGVPPPLGLGIPFIGPYASCENSDTFYTVSNDPKAFPGIPNNGYPFLETVMEFGSLDANYRVADGLTLNSTTGYYWIKALSSVNAISTDYAGSPIVADNDYHRRSWTEELRLTSDFASPLNFTFGTFYENGILNEDTTVRGNTAYGLPGLIQNGLDTVDIYTYSVFGQARYKILPELELAAGARWTDETRRQSPINLVTGELVAGQTPRIHSSEFSPELSITYTPTDDLTFFGDYKKGFKSGSFSVATPAIPFINNAFGDEHVHGGEVGMKSRWFDHQLAFNMAGYIYEFTGLQVGVVQPPIKGFIVTRTVNAGSAETYGIDADTTYAPESIPGLQITGAVNWNKAHYVTLDNVPCWGGQTIAAGCDKNFNPLAVPVPAFTAQDLSGTQMVRAPEWQVNLGFTYTMPVMGDYNLVFSNNNAIFTKFPQFLAVGRPNNDQFQSGYAKIDLGLELHAPDDFWEIALITKNVADKIVAGNCTVANIGNGVVFGGELTGTNKIGPAGIDTKVCWVDPGREVWLRLTLRPSERF
jgi:iron complex outermembrane receptor protein